jgi:RNA polymerase sigma-70 factor (ECF subfamily)
MLPRLPKAGDGYLLGLSDEDLATEMGRGRQEALTVLYERYRASIFHIARRVLGDDGEAEEIVQDVLLGIYQRISQFDAQKGSLKSWLITAAKHRAIDRKRHLQSRGIYDLLHIDEDGGSESHPSGPMPQMSQPEIDQLVTELLETLSDKEREVIKLHFFRGLTLDEVRHEMKESISVVRHLYYGGLKKLQLDLASKNHGLPGESENK